LIGDAQFWKLVESTSRSRKTVRGAKATPARPESRRPAARSSKKADARSRRLMH
jgi:hypothetical protein